MYNSGTDKNQEKIGERMKIMMFCGQCAFLMLFNKSMSFVIK